MSKRKRNNKKNKSRKLNLHKKRSKKTKQKGGLQCDKMVAQSGALYTAVRKPTMSLFECIYAKLPAHIVTDKKINPFDLKIIFSYLLYKHENYPSKQLLNDIQKQAIYTFLTVPRETSLENYKDMLALFNILFSLKKDTTAITGLISRKELTLDTVYENTTYYEWIETFYMFLFDNENKNIILQALIKYTNIDGKCKTESDQITITSMPEKLKLLLPAPTEPAPSRPGPPVDRSLKPIELVYSMPEPGAQESFYSMPEPDDPFYDTVNH